MASVGEKSYFYNLLSIASGCWPKQFSVKALDQGMFSVPNPNYQFGLRDLLLASTAFAITFALVITAFAQQSTFLLFCAGLMFGLSCGGSLGFVFGGRPGIPIGACVGGGIMFLLYAASVQTFG